MLILAGCEKESRKSISESKSKASKMTLNVESPTNGTLYIHSSTTDEEIRELLISHTPMGSDATNVLKFVADELRPQDGALSYFKYVDALETGKTNRMNVVREDPQPISIGAAAPNWTPRHVYAVIGSYPDAGLLCKVAVNWTFDKNDRLLDLEIVRDHGP